PMEGVAKIASVLADTPEIRIAGLMTHLACADAPTNEETAEQMLRFDEATAMLAKKGIRAPLRHAANSAAIGRGQARLDAVRPGIALFGTSPRPSSGGEP